MVRVIKNKLFSHHFSDEGLLGLWHARINNEQPHPVSVIVFITFLRNSKFHRNNSCMAVLPDPYSLEGARARARLVRGKALS